MIPFLYTLRKDIQFQKLTDSFLVISETPLNILRASERAYRVLQRCNGARSVEEIARDCAMTEEQTFRLCHYFNQRAVLEISPSQECGHYPVVSVIIPTKDRREELKECLDALFVLDYPTDRVEVIVIDDGSCDGTSDLVRTYRCVLITNTENRGQSFCRNEGAKVARGNILAFLDSDCVPGQRWLRDLVAYFQWERIGSVGGYVDGYFEETALDRYEKTFSPLNMGKHILFATNNESTLYAPTCNLLVSKQAFMEAGGIKESLRVGEDVDFCWRLRKKGYDTLYVPRGVVYHKHRNSLPGMLRRRADYGTSEAILYGMHSEKKKTVQLPFLATCSFVAVVGALMTNSIYPLAVSAVCLLCEALIKMWRIHTTNLHLRFGKVLLSVARSQFSFSYFISFHLVRYYLAALFFIGLLFYPAWSVLLLVLLISSFVDYCVKRPRLVFPLFLFYYIVDHLSYQLGVIAGCLREKSFGSYSLRFLRKTAAHYMPGH